MKLITYSTHNSGYFDALKISAKNNGFELIVLGFNEEWKGFTQKFIDIKLYLNNIQDKNEIVCFVDGFDCIVLGSSTEMLEKYKSTNVDKILFTVDIDSFLSTQIFGKINEKDKDYKYNRINAGCYIGKVKHILELFTNLCNAFECKAESNDQELLTNYYTKCIDCLNMDYDRNIFYNIQLDLNTLYWQLLIITNNYQTYKAPLSNSYYNFKDKRLILNDNNNKPIIIHGNGDTNMDTIVENLNLPISKKDNKNYFEYSIKPFLKKIKNDNPIITKILYYSIVCFHITFALFINCSVFFTNNIFYLTILIFIWFIIILQWVLLGNCVCSNIENALSDIAPLENGKEPSFCLVPFIYIFGEKITYGIACTYPILIIAYILYKINTIYKNKMCKNKSKK